MLVHVGLEFLDGSPGIANKLCVNNLDAVKVSSRELPVAPIDGFRGAAGGGREREGRDDVEDLHYE